MIQRALFGLTTLAGLLLVCGGSAYTQDGGALPEETSAAFTELLRTVVESVRDEPLPPERADLFEVEIEHGFREETQSYAAYEEELVETGRIEEMTETEPEPEAEPEPEPETELEPEPESEPEVEEPYEDSSEAEEEEESAVNDELLYEPSAEEE